MYRLRTALLCLLFVLALAILNTDIAASAESDYCVNGMYNCLLYTANVEIPQQDDAVPEYVYKTHFGLCAGGGTLGPEHDGFGLFGLKVGRYYPRLRLWSDIGLLYMPMNPSETSETVAGTNNEWELALDLSGRYYFTPSHTLLGLYADAGLRHGILFWRYTGIGRIKDNEDGKVIHADAVGTVHLYAGLGVSFLQTKRLHLSGTFTGGIKFFYSNTLRQFENDLFDPQGFVQFFINLTFVGPKSTTSHKPLSS
jgi:hypothetical protein